MLLQNLADAVCSVFLCEDFKEFFSYWRISGFFFQEFPALRIAQVSYLLFPVSVCLCQTSAASFLLLRCWHIFIYRCIMRCDHIDLRPLLIKNTLFLSYGHQTDLTTILCFCIHAVFCMQPFSICIHPCRNMDTSKPCCQADFSQTVGFQFCDRGIFRIIQHLKRNFCTFCRFSM